MEDWKFNFSTFQVKLPKQIFTFMVMTILEHHIMHERKILFDACHQ